MDNAYLKKNVLPALTEALTAMSVQVPDDQVDFIGKYLISFVERQKRNSQNELSTQEAEKNLEIYLQEESVRSAAKAEKEQVKINLENQYNRFLDTLKITSNKPDAFDSVSSFLEKTLGIPSAYVAVKQVQGDKEFLKFVSAGPKSTIVLGKKILKPSGEEGEDLPERQGVLFESFKVPEVPEPEATEEGEGEPVPKGPVLPQPMVIENVLRDKRVKFFGIPKLGSLVACPFIYSSIDHEGACQFTPAEGETPSSYNLASVDVPFVIAFDSVGAYRLFDKSEIEKVVTIGNILVEIFKGIERRLAEKQLEFLNSDALKQLNNSINDAVGKIPEEEAAALADAASKIPPVEEGAAPPEGAELLKARNDAAAVAKVWSKHVSSGSIGSSISMFQNFVLPLSSSAVKLLYAIGLILNIDPIIIADKGGDASWEEIKKTFIPIISSKISTYDPTEPTILKNQANSLNAIKSYLESNNLLDAGVYPSFLPLFGSLLLPWLQKAIAAREASFAYNSEVVKSPLETF